MPLFAKASALHLGLEVTPDGLALALGSKNNQPQCVDFLPTADKTSAKSALAAWVKNANCAHAQCQLVLHVEDYQLLLIEPPAVPTEEMCEALRWRVQDLLSVDSDQLIIDYFPLPVDGSKSHKPMVYVVVAKEARMRELAELVQHASLQLKAIDIGELAVRNVMHAIRHQQDTAQPERAMMLVRVKPRTAIVTLFREQQLYLARSVSLPYTASAGEALPSEALILEIQRSIDYFERQMAQAPPMAIYLCGEHLTKESLDDKFTTSFSIPVAILDLADHWPNLSTYDVLFRQKCVSAFGGLLREQSGL